MRFCKRPSVLIYEVTFLRHVTSKKSNILKKWNFLQIFKVKGQTQGQGQIKVKGQGHMKMITILYVSLWYSWIYEKWKSASKIVNFQPILLKIDIHIVTWTYPIYIAKNCIDQENVTYVSPLIMNIYLQNLHQLCKGTWWMHKNQITLKCQGQGKNKKKHNKNHENHILSHYFGRCLLTKYKSVSWSQFCHTRCRFGVTWRQNNTFL